MNNSEDISRLLLAHGADVNAKFKGTKWTSLHSAVSSGNSRLVSLLLEHHANTNAKALYGYDIAADGKGEKNKNKSKYRIFSIKTPSNKAPYPSASSFQCSGTVEKF